LSSPGFSENEVNFLLLLQSYNLLSILRGELESAPVDGWDVSRLQRTVLKTAVRVTKGAHRLLIDVALCSAGLWNRLLERMKRWAAPASATKPRDHHARKWVPRE